MAYVLASALAFRVLMDMLFKLSVKNVAFNSIGDFFTSFWKVISSVSFLVAIIVSGINFFLWMMVLSHYDLSFAYPMSGICFALIMVGGKLFFGEHLDKHKLVGIFFILLSSLVLILE